MVFKLQYSHNNKGRWAMRKTEKSGGKNPKSPIKKVIVSAVSGLVVFGILAGILWLSGTKITNHYDGLAQNNSLYSLKSLVSGINEIYAQSEAGNIPLAKARDLAIYMVDNDNLENPDRPLMQAVELDSGTLIAVNLEHEEWQTNLWRWMRDDDNRQIFENELKAAQDGDGVAQFGGYVYAMTTRFGFVVVSSANLNYTENFEPYLYWNSLAIVASAIAGGMLIAVMSPMISALNRLPKPKKLL
jgi:hypothetical protein